jgi:hypothetical protein
VTARISINDLNSDQLDALYGAIDAVRDLHQPMERGPFTICAHCSGWDGKWRCLGVVTDFPCPTVRALDTAMPAGGTKPGTKNGCTAPQARQDPANDTRHHHTLAGASTHDCDPLETP